MEVKAFKILTGFAIAIALLAIYISTYFLLMERNSPAVDDSDEPVFRSSFKYVGDYMPIHGGYVRDFTTMYPVESIFNWIYLPANKAYRFFYGNSPEDDKWIMNLLGPRSEKNAERYARIR